LSCVSNLREPVSGDRSHGCRLISRQFAGRRHDHNIFKGNELLVFVELRSALPLHKIARIIESDALKAHRSGLILSQLFFYRSGDALACRPLLADGPAIKFSQGRLPRNNDAIWKWLIRAPPKARLA
jgi:hypothetical protein